MTTPIRTDIGEWFETMGDSMIEFLLVGILRSTWLAQSVFLCETGSRRGGRNTVSAFVLLIHFVTTLE